ncbi:hypothetical protein SDC9_75729 [bioreactor metagenome]|uniref:Outer membrane protein beta-barrel domain-containing protein n=1 Tax=bioreactor metagenome TaxID=1076179 RepID=A0A644YLI1_9ZZZZ
MKRIVLVVFIVVACLSVSAQDESRITLSANTIQVDNFHAYSINPSFELALNDHWNLRYELGFGVRGNRKFYMHTPVTLPVGGLLFILGLSAGGSFINTLGILMMIVPEGVSYDISLTDDLELSPFIDINSCEYYLTPEYNDLQFLLSGDAGIALRMHISDRFYMSAYSSLTMLESKGLGFSGGLGIGYKFDL